jgi:3-carboxy-cis,cis-muconate cycloisomerase
VAGRLGAALGLPTAAPWHANREGVAGLGAALAIVTGAAAKIARDVSLLAQNEVAEAFEPKAAGRGGSSAMAHKRNPTGCQVALSAGLRAPHLAAAILSGLPQEHERGLGGWQAEGALLAELFGLAHGALVSMREVVQGLEVDPAAMAAKLGDDHDSGESEALVRSILAAWRGPDG